MFTPKSSDPLPTRIGPAPERKKPAPVDRLIGEWLWQLPDGKLAYRPPEPAKEEVKTAKEEPAKETPKTDDYKYGLGAASGRLYRYINIKKSVGKRHSSVFGVRWKGTRWATLESWFDVDLITREEAIAKFPDAFR